MREHRVTLPEIILIGATRALIGLGAGLLISDRIGRTRRERLGLVLFAAGVLSTLPIGLRLRRRAERVIEVPSSRPPIVEGGRTQVEPSPAAV